MRDQATPGTDTPRCESTSPIEKFDEGPRQCQFLKGHSGSHYAKTSGGRHVDPQYDYDVTWEDER
jgi:hypothetical protein